MSGSGSIRTMRTLILGCKGQLGKDLMIVFGEVGEVVGFDLPETDVSSRDDVRSAIEDSRAEFVVNSAAYTDVEAAEDDEEGAFLVNEQGARVVAAQAAAKDIPVVYVGTDFVFDGRKTTPYGPGDKTNPLGVYGRSKLAGENAVRGAARRHFIVRSAWLYGPGGNNFPEKIIAAARKNPSLKVVHEEIGSPTHTWDLALATRALSRTEAYGTYHAVNTGSCARDEFARAILEYAGIETPVMACSLDEFPTKARRPVYSVLSTSDLEGATGHAIRDWRDALKHYIERRSQNHR